MSNYIKVKFPDGIERGLKFNNWGVAEFWRKIDFTRYGATANYAMIWGGLAGNCYSKETETDFTFENVVDWTDAMDKSVIDEISLVLAATDKFKRDSEQVKKAAEDVVIETAEEKKSELMTT